MARDVAVLFVHGINVASQDYAKPAIERLRSQIGKDLRRHATFASAFWGDIVRNHQTNFLERVRNNELLVNKADLKPTRSRRLALEGLGDAAAYQKTPKRLNAPYFLIQDVVRKALKGLEVRDDPSRPLVVIGHSLGCHILSSFIWDVNTAKQYTEAELKVHDQPTRDYHAYLTASSPFCRLDTLAGVVTMGSNMPLFTFTFEPHDVTPITKSRPGKVAAFPGRGLTEDQKRKARWLNFYSRNDLLAYPLKPLYQLPAEYDLLQDIHVRSEGVLASPALFSPLNAFRAHTRYDRNRTVIRQTARLIQDVIEA